MNTKDAIESRKTTKVLGHIHAPNEQLAEIPLEELLTLAGKAPFHYASHRKYRENDQLSGIEPWRFHYLDATNSRRLLDYFNSNEMDTGKIGRMLAECAALVLATWLPDPAGDDNLLFEPSIRNMEHIAATAAAINSLLLASTAEGLKTYWSSGGIMRSPELLKKCGVGEDEILLGAVFIFDSPGNNSEEHPGKLRELKGNVSDYSRKVVI